MKKTLEEIRLGKERGERKLTSLKKYENYLTNVIKHLSDEYNDVKELRSRYENLEKQNANLNIDLRRTEQENKEFQKYTIKYLMNKKNENTALANEISALNQELDVRSIKSW